MKSVEQIAKAAYEAFANRMGIPCEPWHSISPKRREAWIEAVNAVRAEIESVR